MAELLAANQITIAKVLDGEQGIPGEKGADGKTSYFHIKYSAIANPTSSSQMTEEPSAYIGTYVDFTEADSTDPSAYTWSRFEGIQGEHGEQGIPGTNGADGKTSYLHIAYANSADGTDGFSVSDSTGKLYIGQYTDFVQADSTDPSKYAWTKIKGEKGADGEMSAEQLAQLNQASEDASQAKSDVANLEIGGRNLLPFEQWASGTPYEKNGSIFVLNKGLGALYVNPYVFGEVGTEYTFSAKPHSQGSTKFRADIGTYDGTTFTAKDRLGLNSDGAYKSVITRNDVNAIRLNFLTASLPFIIDSLKVEKGNKATDWTPAPEDVQAEIDSIKKRVVIDDDSVDIVDSTGRLLASYRDAKIELGKNAVSSIIEMCGGMARVSARYGGLTTIYSHNGGYQTTLDYDFNETTFKSKVGSNYGFYEFSYSGGVWECSYSGNNAGYVQVNLSDYGITLKTTSINEYAGITIQYWNGSEATFINADTTKPSRKLILGLAESGTADNLNYANIEIERSKKGDVEHSKINLLTVHDGANVAGIYLNNGNIGLDVSGEVRINDIPLDYIVEQGTYIGWTYRKWNSGVAECFGYISLGSISVSAVGNVYRGTATVTLPGIFNDIPSNVHITNGNPLASVISINGRATDADHVSVYIWKATSGAVDSVSASFHVIGTWK